MAGGNLSTDLSVAEVKKSVLRDALEHIHERASSLLLLSLRWKDLDEHYDAARRAVERRGEEVRSVEESVKASFSGFAARLEEIERRESEIASGRRAEFERRREEVERNAEELEFAKREVEERLRGIEVAERRFEEVSSSLGALVDERLREIGERERKVGEREKEIEFRNEKLRERWEAFEASRSKLEGKINEAQLKSEEFEGRMKNLELIEKECDERVKQARLKEKRLQQWSNVLEIQKRELEVRLREVELKDSRAKVLSKEPDLTSKKCQEQNNNVRPAINKSSDEIHPKVLAKSPDTCLKKDGQVSNIQRRAAVDGKEMQIFLNERWTEGEKLRHEVLVTLRKCSDPARLVLDAMEGFYPPHLKKGDVEFDECIVRRSCILLLEQLKKISPIITPQVKTEATKLSFFWITKMRADAENSLEVLGFLQLLATYGLASAFDADEILHYVEKIAQFNHMPELCQALGLKDKIPGLIRDLVKEKQHNLAVKFIHAFKMEDEFPPEPLLKEHMRISKNAAGAILQNGQNSPGAQAMKRRKADLEAGGRCVEDNKIKSTISLKKMRQAITSMEKQNEEQKKAASEIGSIKMRELDGKLHSPAIGAAPVPSSIPASVKSTNPISIETAVKPASETSTPPQHRGKHQRTAALAEVGSNPLAGASSNAQSSHITHKEASCENLCSKPSGKILGKILSREVEYELVRDEISTLLQSSSDPACLVFDTLKCSDPSNSKEFIRLGIPVKRCILLLEHLKRFSPIIKPPLFQEAKQFCNIWKLKLKARKDDHVETICFLHFLAAFKLAPLVGANEVLDLLDPSKWAKQVRDFCESLGLADFLPGFIRNLIEKKHWIDAIKYINALKMEDKFPLVPLLTDYLAHWENRADETSKKKNSSPSSQIGAINKKLTATKTAMKWIATYRLESEFSHKDFEAYIKQLEKQKAEIEGKLRESKAGAGSQHVLTQQDKKEEPPAQAASDHVATSCSDAPPSVTASTIPTSASNSSHQPEKKRKSIAPQPQTPSGPPLVGHPLTQPYIRPPVDTHGYQIGPPYSARPSGYHGLQIPPNNYPFNPYHYSGVGYHGRTCAVPLCGGQPVRFAGPRDAFGGPR
ncbi:FRIGIDA-like protein 5 isoform X2 [Rhodamnia argentea]|uniref:FRIGIDA-like protein 5 isoform X2 n=1 Tax=Rhodamnia argentea TaxID=178133 RepID=A0A8B8NET8_9MYRT|nr:FRIGIDA-like protein 5 isoform X2 [Rhodamnia argentea]